MALKTYNPTSPGRRSLVSIDRTGLHRGKPEKKLTRGISRTGGRNNLGRMTARHRGGGHKRSYRMIDFKRNKPDIDAVVERLEYDPNRTAYIALIRYEDGEKRYILAPQKLAAGDRICSGERVEIRPGNAMPLSNIPVGTLVHNVETRIGAGGMLARAAGAYAQIVGRDRQWVILRLASGEQRLVPGKCLATVGVLSNPDQSNQSIGKAGRNRWLGIRPSVRGVAMNPVDHPHGGGEGRTSGGRHPVTPWGKSTKGAKTRGSKPSDRLILRSRHLRKKRRR